jgi:hypothetical protein
MTNDLKGLVQKKLEGVNPKHFLKKLYESSSELKIIVEDIEGGARECNLYQEFKRHPFQRNGNNERMFKMTVEGEGSVNPLDFENWDDVEAFIDGKRFGLETNNGDFPTEEYEGPKLHIYPDTHLMGHALFTSSHESLQTDFLDINTWEKSPGGLRKKFKGDVPIGVIRGQQMLEKRLENLSSEDQREVTVLYDIIMDFFAKERRQIFAYANQYPGKTSEQLAKEFTEIEKRNNYTGYENRIRKMIESKRAGNHTNPVADRILASTCFAWNLLNRRDKSIVFSNDPDLIDLFDIFSGEILPRYMAHTAVEVVRSANPVYFNFTGWPNKVIESAREHISWAREDAGDNKVALGILYVPKTD